MRSTVNVNLIMAKITKQPYQWNRQSSLKLIELYEQHPCMYVSTRADFSNKHKRREAIEQITAELNEALQVDITADEVQKKINGLRTQFIEVHSKVLASRNNDEGDIYEPTLWCYDKLGFILPYITKRKSTNSQINMNFSPVYIKDNRAHMQIPKQELKPSTLYEGELHVSDDNFIEYCPNEQSWETTSYSNSKQLLRMKRQHSTSPSHHTDVEFGPTIHKKSTFMAQDDLDIFGQFLINEMRTFRNQLVLKKFKRDVLKALMNAQEKDDDIIDEKS